MSALFFLPAAALALAFTPVSRIIAYRIGAVDQPDGRRIHAAPMPRLGGVAMYAAFWLVALPAAGGNSVVLGLFCGSTLLLAAGIYDDARGLGALPKLLCQTAAALVPFAFGLNVQQIALPGLGILSLGAWGYVFALVWIVGLVNTVNLCDGMDGLAAGICCMAALILSWSARSIDQPDAATLMLILAGVTLGFLYFNFHPARVFMGDSGAMFLGYILGGVSLMGTLKTTTVISLFFPLLVLGVPLIDISFAVLRRALTGKSIAAADRGHLHHRLLDVGCSQRQAVIILYVISFVFCLAAVLIARQFWLPAVLLVGLNLIVIVAIMFRRFRFVFSKK
ncbi:MAG: undecaprenyl/decaprenyl-phosphate alpha-N-acetylglucosaminyl 1-phosphate transferase [Gracilibacteraceae bacterium]|jgi:UDP-GlcNAc:undecaprenyl-phosphate GlcNAc-1-phosphate transferase|nr:undecaprenyl/decaprenyl-phosphate alpha-N-acetylglucosaminyl 1-phosphate transferase [Gracilibacteraceae bacterium]